jgi:NAD(P)-dependent dehydrogenase (short-subunit alcohol dehydrogenase family)
VAVALVTGANRGIGKEVKRQLEALGHTVHGGGRDFLDVTDDASVAACVARLDRLDILVNNAAAYWDRGTRVTEPDLEEVKAAFDTNTLGPYRLAVACLPLLRESEHPRIVNVSSGAGAFDDLSAIHPAYSLSKTALNALTVMLARSLPDMRVNAVCPGWVRTDMGGPHATRSVEEGARGVVWAATLPDDGPTGGFFRDGRPISW